MQSCDGQHVALEIRSDRIRIIQLGYAQNEGHITHETTSKLPTEVNFNYNGSDLKGKI